MTDVLAPFTAAVEKLSKKDSTAVLVALLLVFTLITFGIAASVDGPLRWLVGGTGVAAFVAALSILAHAVLKHPDRLKSEELVRMGMLLDWIKRSDVDDDHRSSAAKLLPLLQEQKLAKHGVPPPSHSFGDGQDG